MLLPAAWVVTAEEAPFVLECLNQSLRRFQTEGRRKAVDQLLPHVQALYELTRHHRAEALSADGHGSTPLTCTMSADGHVGSEMHQGTGTLPTADPVATSAAATYLGITERHVRRLLHDGTLRGEQLGRTWAVSSESLSTYAPAANSASEEAHEDDRWQTA